LLDDEVPQLQKYDPYIPPELLRQSFGVDYLGLEELATLARNWRR
jgi:ATP-dependent helicase Lhr and Lhr-like helicase